MTPPTPEEIEQARRKIGFAGVLTPTLLGGETQFAPPRWLIEILMDLGALPNATAVGTFLYALNLGMRIGEARAAALAERVERMRSHESPCSSYEAFICGDREWCANCAWSKRAHGAAS